MDKSWMIKPGDTREYIDSCKSFVDFTVGNCTVLDGKIYYQCKMCRLNRRHLPGVVHEIVVKEADEVDVQKYHELLKKAETPLYDRIKHSKLSATIHLYNWKCVGGLSNKIFSSLLEFINQLLSEDDGSLPVNTYKAKKYLRDMELKNEKIPACRNDCMLF
jgi:hypothetical protein